ncbi:MAG TPA: hypothetical protein VFN22_05225 [Gemmatimonadales bacterium]|nr:hypothetical protein [Gemmatimonadales bacterium]
MLHRVITLTVLSAMAAGNLSSQIPRNAPRLGAPTASATPILVANPYTPRAADSALAVEIGTIYRDRMIDKVAGRSWNVISRQKMREALTSYGYPADAILTADGARLLAKGLSSTRLMIFPTLSKTTDGRVELKARLTGTYTANEMAGYIVTTTQAPGQKIDDFAEKSADAMKDVLKAYAENTTCFENRFTDVEKATSAAEKALKIIDKFAPAEYCLGHIAMMKDSTSAAAEQRFREALTTDPQSLQSYSELGVIYQVRADSAKVISTYQDMLRIDPLNQRLRETAFDLFRRYGNQDAAEQVADEGIRTDPDNTDWYDLKSNACLAQEKYGCAVEELEKLFAVDSTRADTTFFRKINIAARFGDDTVRYAKWAEKGITKYPDDVLLLQDAARAFGMTGNSDGALDATRRLIALNPEDLEPLRVTAVTLGNAGQANRLVEFIPLVKASGDADLQNTFGTVFVQAASKAASTNLPLADTLSQHAMDVGTTDPSMLSYANYYIGANMFNAVRTLSESVRSTKSCEVAREYLAVLQRAKPALEGAALSANEQIKAFSTQALPAVMSELKVVPDMITGFCK